MKAILDEMLAALSRGERVVLSSILASSGSVPRGAGAKMAVFEDDRVLGTIGGGAVERLSIQRAQDALKKGLTAAQETISELRAQIEEGAQKLASAKADCDRQLKAKEEAAEQRIAELEAQHAERLSAAEQERKRLLSELDELRPQVEEYGRVKAHIADIELSARERADALDAATRERLQAMIAACRGHCEQVLSTLSATCESVSNELKRADAAVAQLPEAFTTLEGQLDELKKLEQ